MNDLPGMPSRWKRPIRFSAPAPHRDTLPGPPSAGPSGDLKVAGKGWSLNVPAVVVTGLLALAGGKAWGAAEIKEDIHELTKTTREWRDEDRAAIRQQADNLAKEHQFTKKDIPIIVAVVRRQSPNAKLVWANGWEPDVDFYPAPLSGTAPVLQPTEALIKPPSFDE